MNNLLEQYADAAGQDVVEHLLQMAEYIKGLKIVHVNSTRFGGGVAEILHKLIPLKQALGIDATWEVINGDDDFYSVTKGFHNGLQGNAVGLSENQLHHYEDINRLNAEQLHDTLNNADIVFIHDPQPAAMLQHFPERKGKWIWRCHIDASKPYRPIWKYLRQWVTPYDASIFSLPDFAQPLPHPQFLIPPSIDPLADKNMDLTKDEVDRVWAEYSLDPDRPLIVQVSRFDRFKDPLGVIEAYKLACKFAPLQLVLAGGTATDDPEGAAVLQEVYWASDTDPDIHILELPPDAHRTINALQRGADIVLQKSIKEGFGLTVTEAMWKKKAVIAGDTGGLRLQVVHHYTGFLVRTPQGAALRIRYLLYNKQKRELMGQTGRQHVYENFLLTRHLKEYLALIISLTRNAKERIELVA